MLEQNDRDLVSAVLTLGDRLAESLNHTSTHTVIAGIRSKSGHIYYGVNCDGIHGTCAEIVAYANAVLAVDTDIEAIVATQIGNSNGAQVISPCGNCRQMLFDLAPNTSIIIKMDDDLVALPIDRILPFAYRHTPAKSPNCDINSEDTSESHYN